MRRSPSIAANDKLRCRASEVRSALNVLLPLLPKRHPNPLFKCVALEAVSGGANLSLRLGHPEGDLRMIVRFQAEAEGADRFGPVHFPARRLKRLLDAVGDDDQLAFELDKFHLDPTIRTPCGSVRFEAPEDPDGYFAAWDEPAMEAKYEVAAGQLLAAINQTRFACDVGVTRYAMGGVWFHLDPLATVASDGKRLALWGPVELDRRLGVPDWVLEPLSSVLAMHGSGMPCWIRSGMPCWIRGGHRQINVEVGNVSFYGVELEGRFPRWRDTVGPIQFRHQARVARDKLLPAVGQLCALATRKEQPRGVLLRFDEALFLDRDAGNFGRGEAAVPLQSWSGGGFEILLDAHYLLDGLRAAAAPTITFDLADETQSCRLSAGAWQYYLMPLRY